MAKKGMKRPEFTHKKYDSANTAQLIEGKAKHGKARANPIIAGTQPPSQKVYHTKPFSKERPIAGVYAQIDNDLARDNLENDDPAADFNEL